MANPDKMKIEIWSDVSCPFCYIGKHNFEKALQIFPDAKYVETEWKSYQLDPSIPERQQPKQNVPEYLAVAKAMSMDAVRQMTAQVTAMADKAGLKLDFGKAVSANTLKAHRLIQMAKQQGCADAMEEELFEAHFSRGLDVSDDETLIRSGIAAGLTEAGAREALANEAYAYHAQQDILEARNIGVSGVPFFVFDRKYAVSGAQPEDSFLKTLEKSYTEWRRENPVVKLEVSEGPNCTTDGLCE